MTEWLCGVRKEAAFMRVCVGICGGVIVSVKGFGEEVGVM
jgi:hypothetical protein